MKTKYKITEWMEQIVNKKYFFKLYFHNHIKYKRFKHYKKRVSDWRWIRPNYLHLIKKRKQKTQVKLKLNSRRKATLCWS